MLPELPDPTALLTNPVFVLVVAVVIRYAVAYQRQLSWPEYRTLHAAKRALFPVLDPVFPRFALVNAKAYRDDSPEFVLAYTQGFRPAVRALRDAGASLHLLSSLKVRETPEGQQYTAAHLRWRNDDGRQTEVFLFHSVDGPGVDVYTHTEAWVEDPDSHVRDTEQVPGDPEGRVKDALVEHAGGDLLREVALD